MADDSDSDDSDDALRAKRARRALLRPTAGAGARCAAPVATVLPKLTQPAVQGGALPADGRRHSTASPSVRYNPRLGAAKVRAGDLGVSLHASTDVPSDATQRLLLKQNAAIMAELAKQSQQLISLQTLVFHLCRELGAVHNAPHMLPPVEQLFNPYTDQAERPGAKEQSPIRGLDPREIGWLHSQIEQMSAVSDHRCEGFRRIVDPLGWHQAKEIDVPLVDLGWRTQWQLWHYAFGDQKKTSLSTVMTAQELEYSSIDKGQTVVAPSRPLLHEDTFRSEQCKELTAELDHMRAQHHANVAQARRNASGGDDREI